MNVRPGDIIILLSPRPLRGFAAVVDEATSDGCTAHLLDAESLPSPFSSNQYLLTRQTAQSIAQKYERTSAQLDSALGLERAVPEFFSKKTKKAKKTATKKVAGKKLSKSQRQLLAAIIKEMVKETED